MSDIGAVQPVTPDCTPLLIRGRETCPAGSPNTNEIRHICIRAVIADNLRSKIKTGLLLDLKREIVRHITI
jgi:hypothetical protein